MGIFSSRKTILLKPKTEPGPESAFKEFPLLYLYFDDLKELQDAAKLGAFDVGMHRGSEGIGNYKFRGILANEGRFLDFYRKDMIRISLHNGKKLYRSLEKKYWDWIEYPEKYIREPFSDPEMEAAQQADDKEINALLEAIKQRYGM